MPSQLTTDRMNSRPFLKRGISMADVAKYKEHCKATAAPPALDTTIRVKNEPKGWWNNIGKNKPDDRV